MAEQIMDFEGHFGHEDPDRRSGKMAADAEVSRLRGVIERAWHECRHGEGATAAERILREGMNCPPFPPPGSDATTTDGRFVSGPGYGGERV